MPFLSQLAGGAGFLAPGPARSLMLRESRAGYGWETPKVRRDGLPRPKVRRDGLPRPKVRRDGLPLPKVRRDGLPLPKVRREGRFRPKARRSRPAGLGVSSR